LRSKLGDPRKRRRLLAEQETVEHFRFGHRREGGEILSRLLLPYASQAGNIVLALPRGGVPVAEPVANALGAPLDVLPVRSLGVPGHAELAVGAVASGGVEIKNEEVIQTLGLSPAELERVVETERAEVSRRERAYRGRRKPPRLAGRTVFLVADGLVTGSIMRAAVRAVRRDSPERVIAAAPIASNDVMRELEEEVDAVVCAIATDELRAVGDWYWDFRKTNDRQVRALLARAEMRKSAQRDAR
jgi:predicted phosphoribosyltransferase